jgi:hypothetical protein
MALISTNRIAWTYTDDQGRAWRVAAQKGLTDQAVLGGAPADETVPARPNWGKMRRITVHNNVGHSRVVTMYEQDAPIKAAGTSINMNRLGDSEAFHSGSGFLNETRQGGHTTSQSA